MRTRFRLGISVLFVAVAMPSPASTQGAVTVIGGGLAQSCYEAAETQLVAVSRAIEICDAALQQEALRRRDKAATYTNRGILHMRSGNNARALFDYQRSLETMPDLKEAKVNLGAALYNLKRYPEALAALNEGIGTDQFEAQVVGYYNRGLTHEKLGDLQSAYEDFRQALDLKPDFKLAADQLDRFTVIKAEPS